MSGEDQNINAYLNKIGEIPLIDKREEVKLAKDIIAGIEATDKLKAEDNGDIELTNSERRKFIMAEQTGKTAKKKFIESNLRLVVSIARKYSANGMTMLDLIQEGNIGLMKAVDKFDYTQGNKFSTYATWWIKQAIQRGINDKARTVRIPEDVVKEYGRLLRVESEYLHEGLEPTIEELAEKAKTTVARIEEIREFFQGMTSLDMPVGDEGDASFGDFIEDTHIMGPEDSLDKESLEKQIEHVLGSLNERSRQIIRLRFGFVDNRVWTLEELGKEFGITRERVRQIEAKAIQKLQETEDKELLKEFL